MSVLLVKSGGQAALAEWRRHFAEAAPGLAVHWWDDPAVDPAQVRYAFPGNRSRAGSPRCRTCA